MVYCKLCEDYISLLTLGSYCEVCRTIKNIQRVYGKKEVLDILVDICLRDEIKRENKKNNAIANGLYSPNKNNHKNKEK